MPKQKEKPLTLEMDFGEAVERIARVNTKENPEQESGPGAQPFVKWVGGKRSIMGELIARVPGGADGPKIKRYLEPFVGGGALFFGLHKRINSGLLSDSNFELVCAYNAIKQNPNELTAALQEHAKRHNKDYYLRIRRQHHLYDEPVRVAARFIYLNKTCYNGLYRVNKRGEFNVPMGRYKNPAIVNPGLIQACSKALGKAQIHMLDFDEVSIQSGDFIYCDPPYHPVSATSDFTSYTKHDFTEHDQARLRDWAIQAHKAGAMVMLSNSDTPFVRDLYKGKVFQVDTIQAPRLVNCKSDSRGAVNELVITSYKYGKADNHTGRAG